MNFRDLKRYSQQAVQALVPPAYYLHRKPPLPTSDAESSQKRPNFQEQLSAELLETLADKDKGKQYILIGLASEGKTTEIRRLAYTIQQQLNAPRKGFSKKATVHLLSMQNYSGSGADIRCVDDLWGLLLACHQARNIARQRLTFDEFSNLHAASDHRPILLIDTLDMLAYGRTKEDVSHVTQIWADLVQRMDDANMTVLWSVRPNEIDIKSMQHRVNLSLVELPQLAWDESLALARQFVGDTLQQQPRKPLIDFQVFSALLLVEYPILAKYMKRGNGRADSLRAPLFNTLKQMYDEFSESKAYQNVHPLDWVMKKTVSNRSKDMATFEAPRGNFIVDELYKISRSEILHAMNAILHISEEDLEEVWYNHVEVKLFDEIEEQSASFTNRLWLPSTLDDGYGETSQIYEYLIMIGGNGDDAYGLFSIEGDRVSFQHQLFAEYAVYRAAWSEEKGDVAATAAIHIPSCRLRMRAYPLDDDSTVDAQVNQFMKWFKPFFTMNRDLQSLPDDAPQRMLDSEPWETARNWAQSYKRFQEDKTNPNDGDEQYLGVSEDKRSILDNHRRSKDPLTINGPAGTGKSYIANPFIYSFVARSRKTGDLNEGRKPMVKFVTLSSDLATSFMVDHHKFMGGRDLPITLESQPVDELLMHLDNAVCGGSHQNLTEFSKQILTENKFVFTLSKDIEFTKNFRSLSIQSLWHEFLDVIIDEGGNEVGHNNYVDDDKIYSISQIDNREKRRELYGILQRLDLLNTKRIKTRRKIASDIIDGLTKVLIHGDDFSKATELMERLKPYRTDVLLVDEVQDLGSAVLKLCFILHKGQQADVAILGDREQTLELHQFDWEDIFSKIGSSLFDLAQTASSSNFGDLLELEKWNHRSGGSDLSNSVTGNRLEHFKVVHRNVPPIVDLMRWSFLNAAKTEEIEHLFDIPDGGTASISTSEKRVEDYAHWKADRANHDGELPWGVFYLGSVNGKPTKISLNQLLKIIEKASYSDEPIEIILPDEYHRKLISRKLSEDNIQQTVWDPVTIKGLENTTIIAVSPWSIHTERLTQFVRSKEDSTWEEKVRSVPPNKRGAFVKIVEQRRRHANVMLSRPKNTLFILTLRNDTDDGIFLTDTTEPNFEEIIGDNDVKNIMAEIDTPAELETFLMGEEGDVRDPSRHMELLEKLILQSRGLDQIGIKALQVYNIASGILKEDPGRYQMMFSKFIFIDKYCKDVHGIQDTNVPKGISYIADILFGYEYRNHDLMKYDRETITPLQKAFDDWQLRFYKLSDKFEFTNEGVKKLEYTTEAYDQLVALFNELIEEISGFNADENYQKFEAIRDFVFEEIFGGTIDDSESQVWFERARKMSLRGMEMEHILVNDRRQHRIDELLDIMALFKKEYYHTLVKDSSPSERDSVWSSLLSERGYPSESIERDQLSKLRPYHDRQLTERQGSVGVAEASHQSAFWIDGIHYLNFNEFTVDQLRVLEQKFFDLLAENEDPADEHPWLADQIRWLLHLLVHSLDRSGAENALLRLLDLERYAEEQELHDERFSLGSMVSDDVAPAIWKELQIGGGEIDRAWAGMLRMNHFHLYTMIKDHMVKSDARVHESNVLKVERFYRTAALLSCLDHPSEMHPDVLTDLEERIQTIVHFVNDPAFLDLGSIAVNKTTVMRYYNSPADGLLGGMLTRAFTSLDDQGKTNLLQHVLGAYIGAHSNTQDYSLGSIFKGEKGMGLLPQTSVRDYTSELFEGDGKRFGELLNQLFPIHSKEERGNVEYYPVHVDTACMETPSMVYNTDGGINPDNLKDSRNSWLNKSLGYAFENELCDLNHVEFNAIYTLGLNEFAQIVTFLSRAPNRFGNFAKVWGRDMDVKQIHQQYVRYFLREHINKEEWVNSNYRLIDNADNPDNIRIFLGGLHGRCIQLELDRYLQFERLSRFLLAHISDLPSLAGRDLYNKETSAFEELFSVNSLIRQLVDAWVEGEGSAALTTIIQRFWDNLRIAVPPTIDLELSDSIETLFEDTDCQFAYGRVLGTSDGFTGFYGAARKLLTMFGGTTEIFGKIQIKGYNGNDVAPQSGSGQIVIGERIEPLFQRNVLLQINDLQWEPKTSKPMAELNRLSKAGKISWYDGFSPTDLGQRPFDESNLEGEH